MYLRFFFFSDQYSFDFSWSLHLPTKCTQGPYSFFHYLYSYFLDIFCIAISNYWHLMTLSLLSSYDILSVISLGASTIIPWICGYLGQFLEFLILWKKTLRRSILKNKHRRYVRGLKVLNYFPLIQPFLYP